MSRRVSFRPEAEAEALETRDWYEGRRLGLGGEFRAALDETIEGIADNPTQISTGPKRDTAGDPEPSLVAFAFTTLVAPASLAQDRGIPNPRSPNPGPAPP